jgi:hypothetical protein
MWMRIDNMAVKLMPSPAALAVRAGSLSGRGVKTEGFTSETEWS